MCVRWDEITLAYAAYAEPLTVALADGHPTALLGSWIGLHPPAWGVIHAVMEQIAPIPFLWMGFSVCCSIGAVWVVGRTGGWLAAFVLATAPVHLWDAAEVNNYPLSALAMALLIAASRGTPLALAVAAVFAAWCHLLTGVAAAGVVLWKLFQLRSRGQRDLVLLSVAGVLPVAGGAIRLMGQGSTWVQPDVSVWEWMRLVGQTMGIEGVLLVPLVVIGLTGSVRVAWCCVVAALILAVGLDAAAAHQRPYLGLIAPAAAVAVGVASEKRRWLLPLIMLLCVVRGGRFAAQDIERVRAIMTDLETPRGIDMALKLSEAGDTVWLVSPALQTDDDKSAYSSVLWRIRPWSSMPIARPVDFEYKNYRYGQPREFDGLTIHTSTELDDASFDHVAEEAIQRGARIWLVLYDHGPASGLVERVERTLQPYSYSWTAVGEDLGLGVDKVATIRGFQ
jgi:hypothetical protein